MPDGAALHLKGVCLALADGIGSSRVSGIAASIAVRSMLEDYYCTPETWPVRQAASRVIAATNAWLHAQTLNGEGAADPDRGYVCTLDVLILKGRTAHLFHVGDGRIARVVGRSLEKLTQDHRVAISSSRHHLARAVGAGPQVEIDAHTLPIEAGDVFVLSTDGVHDHLPAAELVGAIGADLDAAAAEIVARALAAGSPDNLSVQLVRIETIGTAALPDLLDGAAALPPAPLLAAGQELDGFRVIRTLRDSARSHLYLAEAPEGGLVALKVPSVELAQDVGHLRRFAAEEWIARRIDSPHVLRHRPPTRPRSCLYLVMDYVDGQTLAQWMRDHPRAAPEQMRPIVAQVARGLDAFHRRAMCHGDLRPDNVMIDAAGTVRLLDFGSVRVPGVEELRDEAPPGPLGTAQYSAPEVLLGAAATPAADVFSLGVIAYQMLTGRLPYGTAPAQARDAAGLRRLRYRPATEGRPTLPAWLDAALRKAVHPSPRERYEASADFMADLQAPNPDLVRHAVPLAERDPAVFWKTVALALAVLLAVAVAWR